MTLWTRLYEHNDYRGRSTFASLSSSPASNTYLQIDKSWLDAQNLHDRISSLEFGASSLEKGGHLILFQHAGYKGRYARFAATPGATVSRPNLTAQSFNDITSSVLLVRKHTREMPPMALGGMGTPTLREQIAAEVAATPNISMRGTPVISWDMWPSFAPSQKFVYVAIPVVVDVPNWFDYDAEIRLWIYLYVDGAGKVRGYVSHYGAWVEGGILTGKILDRLMSEIPGAIGSINARITNALSLVSAFTFVGLYYLPGTVAATGNTNDDVSLVLVKEW